MTLPSEAVFERALGDGVAVWDVSELLPRGDRRYQQRDVAFIHHVIVHKSGADGPAGYAGAEGCARYVTRPKPAGRGWPGMPYTYWLPRMPDVDAQDRLVVYRCQPDRVRSYHTGGYMNAHGIGIGIQGNYDGDWDLVGGVPRIERVPTPEQVDMLGALVDDLVERHRIEVGKLGDEGEYGLTGHWEHGKSVCPGDFLRMWVIERRKSRFSPVHPPAPMPVAVTGQLSPARFDFTQRQRALAHLGHYAGELDGIWGFESRAALERFQDAHGLVADGWWGPNTARAMTGALESQGLLLEDDFYKEPGNAVV